MLVIFSNKWIYRQKSTFVMIQLTTVWSIIKLAIVHHEFKVCIKHSQASVVSLIQAIFQLKYSNVSYANDS